MTYSIVARCPKTGHFGVAVQSHWFGAGIVCWAKAGIGAVATQAMALIDHGPIGIDLMESGLNSTEAMRKRISNDQNPEIRQVAMIDSSSRVTAHTGSETIPESGHLIGDGYSCQANMMWKNTVWAAMSDAFSGSNGDLSNRMLSALKAAEAEDGDIRGKQSARLLVVDSKKHSQYWNGVILDISIDDHKEPLEELDRLLDLHTEYSTLKEFDGLEPVEKFLTKIPEVAFWKSITLVDSGRIDEARELAAVAFEDNIGWEELLRRCAKKGLAGINDNTVKILLPTHKW